jgi:hypothetical protein
MSLDGQMQMIRHDLKCHDPPAVLAGLRTDQLRALILDPVGQDRATVLRAPHDLIPRVAHATRGNLNVPGHAEDL